MSRIPQYRPVAGAHLTRAQAQSYGPAIDDLIQSRRRLVTPEELVEVARSKRSRLHDWFEWDDQTAATAHRSQQAAYLLRSINVVILTPDGQEEEVRAFQNVVIVHPQTQTVERGYLDSVHVFNSDDYRRQVLGQVLRELEALQQKYGQYTELNELFETITRLKAKLVPEAV